MTKMNCHIGSQTMAAIECCSEENFCNRDLVPELKIIENPSGYNFLFFLGGGMRGSSLSFDFFVTNFSITCLLQQW